jgi:hypothetical protein
MQTLLKIQVKFIFKWLLTLRMTSGDHFVCDSCNYEWRTRKDVGDPFQCVKCRSNNIEENGVRRRRIAREAEERRRREKEYLQKQIELAKLIKQREKEKQKRKLENQKRLIFLKEHKPYLYYFHVYKWLLLVSLVVIIILSSLLILSLEADSEVSSSLKETPMEAEPELIDREPAIISEATNKPQYVEKEIPIVETPPEEPQPTEMPPEVQLPLTAEDFFEQYSQGTYTLMSPFMNYNPFWIVETNGGWRDRFEDGQSLHSFVYSVRASTEITIPLANGCYTITTYHGDPGYAQGPHYIKVEEEIFNEESYTLKDEYIHFSKGICIQDNELNLVLGSELTKEYTFRGDGEEGWAMLNAVVIKPNSGKEYVINFGPSWFEEFKGEFLKSGIN